MRITTVHAVNVLSFENVTVEVDAPLTVFVGPNGAGKTNVFRVVRQAVDVLQLSGGLNARDAWDTVVGTFQTRRRDDNEAVTLELGVRWDRDDERAMLAAFVRGVLGNMNDMARHIGNGSRPGVDATAWAAWVDALTRLVPETELTWLFEGTLGVQYRPDGELVAYYRPVAASDWLVLLRPECGIVRALPAARWSSYGPIPLMSLWMKSLSAGDRTAVETYFTADGPGGGAVPVIPFHWRDLVTQVPAAPLRLHDPRSVIPLEIEPAHGSPLPAAIAALYTQVGLLNPNQQGITLLRVMNRLLADRLVVSEDLLSPPTEHYDAQMWPRCANPLTSRHLGAHLLALKVGDDAARARFAAIQETFRVLASRALDVTWTPGADAEELDTVTLVQQGNAERHSTSLATSGSGLVELAYLSALWNLPGSHVLLLDEPGRSLHPQGLIRIRQLLESRSAGKDGAQILTITHSAFVVPTANLAAVRHFRRGPTGATNVWALSAEGDQSDEAVEKRQERWGRSVNWPALLFSSVVLLVDGESEWAALPIWYACQFHEPLEASGITLLWVGGKSGNGPAIRDLVDFSIPWVALIDGDSLKRGRDNIWRQLQRVCRLSQVDANAAQDWCFADAVVVLRERHRVFVAGDGVEENFDTLIERLFSEDELPDNLRVSDRASRKKPKVLRALWAARNRSCPPVIDDVFATVRAVAQGAPLDP